MQTKRTCDYLNVLHWRNNQMGAYRSQLRCFTNIQPLRVSSRKYDNRATRRHAFDTLKVVKELEGAGFTQNQSITVMRILDEVVTNYIAETMMPMVAREEFDQVRRVCSLYTGCVQ